MNAPVSSATAATQSRPLIMGIVNVTPDSFSDGGAWLDPAAAADQALRLVADGADLIDLGAESSRPGAAAVPLDEEWRRLEPVLAALARRSLPVPLSVDTCKPEIMLRAVDCGARLVNDVAGGAPNEILRRLAANPGVQYLAMHRHGTAATMQAAPLSAGAAVAAVEGFCDATHARLSDAGFEPGRIWLDPGIGFGKTDAANIQLMRGIARWSTRYQIAVGVSRKSLLGRVLGIVEPARRDDASKMLELGLALLGAGMIRTHEVARLRRLVDLMREDA